MEQDRRSVFAMPGLGLLLIGMACLLMGGCSPGFLSRSEIYSPADKGAIAGEIARLEQVLSQGATPANKDKLLMRLAILYSHPDNPDPDYKRALACMEAYVEIRRSVDSRYALAFLTQLEACDAKSGTLGQENRKLKQRLNELEQENQNNKTIIEKLKRLDIQLEKKRKNMQ